MLQWWPVRGYFCAYTFSEAERKKKVNESERGDDGPSEDPGGLGSHAGAPGVCPDGIAGSAEGTGGAPDAGTCAAGWRRRGDGGPAEYATYSPAKDSSGGRRPSLPGSV